MPCSFHRPVRHARPHTWILACPLACLLACMTACTGPMNESISPGEDPLPVFAEADDDPVEVPLVAAPTELSLTHGHDRLGWPMYTMPVPVYRVRTNPAPDYRGIVLSNDSPRQKGAYPTSETALDVRTTDGTTYLEGFTDLVSGTGAILLSPVEMILRDWQPHPRSPQHKFAMVDEPKGEALDRWFVPVNPVEAETGAAPDADDEPADTRP